MRVPSLGREDPLEEAWHLWRIPWTQEPGGLQHIGSQRAQHNWSNWARTHAWFQWFEWQAKRVLTRELLKISIHQNIVIPGPWEAPLNSHPVSKSMASLVAQLVKNLPAMQETPNDSWVGKICWRRDRLPSPVFLGFPGGSDGKESACNVGDLGLIPGLGRSPGEGKGYPLQYSGLENSMDCIVHGVAKSQTGLSNFHFTLKPISDSVWRLKPSQDLQRKVSHTSSLLKRRQLHKSVWWFLKSFILPKTLKSALGRIEGL